MKRLIAVTIATALVALASPAVADGDCTSGTVYWMGSAPMIGERTATGTAAMSIDGLFIQVEVDTEATIAVNGTVIATAPAGERVSVGVPSDAELVEVCVGTADDAPEAVGQESEAVGGVEAEHERATYQEIADVSAEEWEEYVEDGGDPDRYRHSYPGGAYPI